MGNATPRSKPLPAEKQKLVLAVDDCIMLRLTQEAMAVGGSTKKRVELAYGYLLKGMGL